MSTRMLAEPAPATETPAAEALAAELVGLVRGLRELAGGLPPTDGHRLDLPAAAVLGQVGDAGALRLSTLAERLCLDVSTVSRQVPTLERAGWLVREPDPADRRACLLTLTEQGRHALTERRRAYARVLAAALPAWSDEELSALARSLSRLNADLSASAPAGPTSLSARSQVPVAQEAS